jgi:hypothetical protein
MNCIQCGKTPSEVKKCGRCRKTRYCSRKCQKKHWKIHKIECQKREIVLPDIVSTEKYKFGGSMRVKCGGGNGESCGYTSIALPTLKITVFVYDLCLRYIKDRDVCKHFQDVDKELQKSELMSQLPFGYTKIYKKGSRDIIIHSKSGRRKLKLFISEYVMDNKKVVDVFTLKKNRSGKVRSLLYLTSTSDMFLKFRVTFDEKYTSDDRYSKAIDNFIKKLVKKTM